MAFTTIFTNVGLGKVAEAVASGTTIALHQMAVGDGNGNPTTPSASQTSLVRERYRAAISRSEVDGVNPNKLVIDLQVPAAQGGWTIHEVGVFDSLGALVAVANFPATYKPLPSEGAARDLIVRLAIEVGNAGAVTVSIDPTVVTASRQWVIDNFMLGALLPGGTTGQVLRKKSNATGDTEWANPALVNIIVSTIEEEQTLTAGQTIVDLAQCTTVGVAVYIEGARYWNFTKVTATQVVLGQTFPTGTKVLFVQNDPLNSVGGKTVGSLVVLESVSGTPGLPDVDGSQLTGTPPPGTVAAFARFSPPPGWLACDGALVSRATYAKLFAAVTKTATGDLTSGQAAVPNCSDVSRLGVGMYVEGPGVPNGTTIAGIIGNTLTLSQNVGTTQLAAPLRFFLFGSGNGVNTFAVPDLRGEFVRGSDDGRGADPSRVIGSAQADATKSHTHTNPDHTHTTAITFQHNELGSGAPTYGDGGQNQTYSFQSGGVNGGPPATNATGGTETRPRNVALLYCIRH